MASSSSCSTRNPFLPSLSLHQFPLNLPLPYKFKTLKLAPNCFACRAKIETNADQNNRRTIKISEEVQGKRKHRKPKPSFYDQISEKWSRKPTLSANFPWQREQAKLPEAEALKPVEVVGKKEVVVERLKGLSYPSSSTSPLSESTDGDGFSTSNVAVAPWGRIPRKIQSNFEKKMDENLSENEGPAAVKDNFVRTDDDPAVVQKSMKLETESGFSAEVDASLMNSNLSPFDNLTSGKLLDYDDDSAKVKAFSEASCSDSSARETMADSGDTTIRRMKKGNAELAESIIPDYELKRLRNVALRMFERFKVGEAGITQSLVDQIHEKWKIDEVVKLKFEGSLAINMRRTHETLERKTGGLVIWRSGSSVVLFKGMNYKLDCVQSYNKEKSIDLPNPGSLEKSAVPDSLKLSSGLSEEELTNMSEFQDLLETLGPPYEDWTGSDPKPVDADLLPGVIPSYSTPFRLLPYGMKQSVRNKEMTFFRRQARRMRPHFALGMLQFLLKAPLSNRQLEGLAAAMVKLWEKSAIAKITIKRGVLDTCNDKMAEDLKKLTGGTLVSRNKEYIVFYRGNDFLPPAVTESLKEREKLTGLQHQEEEAQRDTSFLIDSTDKTSKRPLVAGTLAETMAATSRWGKQADSDDLVKMLKDSAIARHASLVKYLENKLTLAKRKLDKAERALSKVQEFLQPSELPSDQELITDEERFLFRKMGLSMKPFLLLGRRGVFDGTIQNMHLHWKFRELVKIIVKGKSFAQVKHVAISLEAESGGVFVSIDKTTKGYAIIIYRGKNYQRPLQYRPRNLLTRRQALARSIELQRCEAIKHHVADLVEKIELIKSELDDMENIEEIDDKTLYTKLDGAFEVDDDDDDDDWEEEEDEEAYLEVYDSGDDNV
ncbi:hypothetical protein V2J09_002505 [Rumex salicifolius]